MEFFLFIFADELAVYLENPVVPLWERFLNGFSGSSWNSSWFELILILNSMLII